MAQDDLNVANSLDPNQPDLYFNLGIIQERKHNDEAALEYFIKAQELNCKRHGLEYRVERLKGVLGK